MADSGSYFLQVVLRKDAATRPVRYQFKVAVTGTALQSSSPSPSVSSSPSASSSATSSADPSAGASSSSQAGQSSGDRVSATEDGGNGLLWTVLAALLVLVLLAVAAVGYALTRLRGRGAGPT